ncbi:MAG: hypothetical protein PHO56_03980 [Patescibacteria group bacterium]|nr:hypothetical protein [Patescibacteria group bacterium]
MEQASAVMEVKTVKIFSKTKKTSLQVTIQADNRKLCGKNCICLALFQGTNLAGCRISRDFPECTLENEAAGVFRRCETCLEAFGE